MISVLFVLKFFFASALLYSGLVAKVCAEADSAWSFKPLAGINQYALHESSPYFSGVARSWLETSVRAGGRLDVGSFAFEAVGLALRTTGRDPYGTGSAPTGSPPDTPWRSTDPVFGFDTLYMQYTAMPYKLTLGRQPITLGTQFLIGDGVYDGFHHKYSQAVYHNPRRSFDALRIEGDTALAHLDAFIYRVHPTWDGGGEWNGWFGGTELSWRRTGSAGPFAAGLFYRKSYSNLDNDMWVASLRGEQRLPDLADWYLSGEWVGETGIGRNPAYVTTPGQALREQAWHAELGWEATTFLHKPFAEAGYVYYSKDYTPVATGFSDWGKWYLGNQIDWIIFGSNTRIERAQVGFWPLEQVKLRIQYHQTRLVSGPDGVLSDELSLIGEWFPDQHWWVSALLGYARPGSALAQTGFTNPFSYFNSGAVSVGDTSSVDVVTAFGYTF